MTPTGRTCSEVLAPVLALVLALVPAASAPADEISWRTDYNKARQEATEQGRPIVIDFTTESCYWCRQLEARTFIDPEIIQALNQRCVALRVDGNKNPQLAQALNIQSYPTLVYASPDGKILGYHEGFLEAPKLKDHLVKLVASVSDPDWMLRDFRDAVQAQGAADFPRTVSLLRHVLEDGRDRPIQVKAKKLLGEVESLAAARLKEGRILLDQGKSNEAYAVVRNVVKDYRGTPAAQEGDQLLVSLASRAEVANTQRSQKAKELLVRAREDYRGNQLVACLDRCEMLMASFGDLPEGVEARQLLNDLRSNPEQARAAAEQMADRLGSLYLSIADGWIQKGQPQQAIVYLERTLATAPGSRHADMAQVRLAQLKGPKP